MNLDVTIQNGSSKSPWGHYCYCGRDQWCQWCQWCALDQVKQENNQWLHLLFSLFWKCLHNWKNCRPLYILICAQALNLCWWHIYWVKLQLFAPGLWIRLSVGRTIASSWWLSGIRKHKFHSFVPRFFLMRSVRGNDARNFTSSKFSFPVLPLIMLHNLSNTWSWKLNASSTKCIPKLIGKHLSPIVCKGPE